MGVNGRRQRSGQKIARVEELAGGVLRLERGHDDGRGRAPDSARGFWWFWRWWREWGGVFGAWAAGQLEAGGRLDAQHVTQGAEAAGQHGVARDE